MPVKNTIALIIAAVLFTAAVWFGTPAAGPSPDAPLSASQTRQIEGVIGRYLRENPTVIVEAIRNLQRQERDNRNQQAVKNLVRYRQQLINNPTTPFVGKKDASVTVVEFFDYRCPYCKRMLPALKKLLRDDADVRYVFKEFPILTAESRLAAQVALAAWKIDRQRYFALHAALMGAPGTLSEKRIMKIAENSGLDMAHLAGAMKSSEVADEIRANALLAGQMGITGTPAFIIGERIVPGAIDYSTIKKMIAEARAKSG